MSAGFGVAASLGIGIGDHLSRGAAERGGLRQTLAVVFLVSTPVSVAGAILLGSEWRSGDMLLGALTGILAVVSLFCLYLGYASASAGVVGPPAAVIAVALPVTVDLATGGVPAPRVVTGIVVGVVSVLAISYAPHFVGDLRRGLLYSIGAGFGYGSLFIVLDHLSVESGFWPIVLQRMVAFGFVAGACLVAREPVLPGRSVFTTAALGAACASVGALSFVYGVQHGDLAPIAVTGTQYAAVTVVCGILFRGERLFWWQVVGLCGTVSAVGLIVTG
jgi:drug/metabolite transporter (DMT)-like permease